MRGRKSEAFDSDDFTDAIRVEAGVEQGEDSTERVTDEMDGGAAQDVDEGRNIQNMFGDAVAGTGSPGAIAVTAKVHGVDVEMPAKRAGHPIPVAGVIEAAMHKKQRGEAGVSARVVLAPIPELQLEAIGIVIVRDGFQGLL
jgi:hypothetical protein